jgi:CBS domain-containing protein
MQVAELMMTDLTVVNEDASVSEAVIRIADAHVHGVPVVSDRGQVIGVLSSSDIVLATAEHSGTGHPVALDDTLVREIMSTPPQTVRPEADVRLAARQMLEHDVHRLFVLSSNELVGVISSSDIVRAVADGAI